MSKMDPHDRINLTGPWAGFGFQGDHMFTPEGHQLEPCDMAWWSLTCNIAREWRLTRSLASGKRCATTNSSVVYLREYVRTRRERRFGMGDPGAGAEVSNTASACCAANLDVLTLDLSQRVFQPADGISGQSRSTGNTILRGATC